MPCAESAVSRSVARFATVVLSSVAVFATVIVTGAPPSTLTWNFASAEIFPVVGTSSGSVTSLVTAVLDGTKPIAFNWYVAPSSAKLGRAFAFFAAMRTPLSPWVSAMNCDDAPSAVFSAVMSAVFVA